MRKQHLKKDIRRIMEDLQVSRKTPRHKRRKNLFHEHKMRLKIVKEIISFRRGPCPHVCIEVASRDIF
jgi:hypothetical protein